MLLRLEVRQAASERLAVRARLAGQPGTPGEVGFVAREAFEELIAGHRALVDQQLKYVALSGTHFAHQRLDIGAQALDGSCGEPHRPQLLANRVLRGQEYL